LGITWNEVGWGWNSVFVPLGLVAVWLFLTMGYLLQVCSLDALALCQPSVALRGEFVLTQQ